MMERVEIINMKKEENEVLELALSVEDNFILGKNIVDKHPNIIKIRFYSKRGLPIKGVTNFIYSYDKQTILSKARFCPDYEVYVVDLELHKTSKFYCPPKEMTDTSLCIATKLAKEVLDKSDKKGLKKYGMLLDDNLKDNFLTHAKEEAGDLLKYLVHVEEHFKNLCNNYPNDQDLGKLIRKIYG